jgi:predicted dehydrogenase
MFTLAFLDPGHFHAALTLRERHPLVREDVYVYARPGRELDAFLALVRAFNARAERPTAWRPTVYAGEQPLERLLAERKADAVVLAGRNDSKTADLRRLHAAGLHVLGDKPWVAGPAGLPDLAAATDGAGALAMDIMTTRHELTSVLLRKLVAEPEVFGAFRGDGADGPDGSGGAAIEIASVHHLYKLVNEAPLVRPAWYFDIRAQGDGVVDVPTHLADLVQWLLGGPAYDFARDVHLDAARRWATPVPAERFTQITQVPAFPPELREWVQGGALQLLCNGELAYRLRGLPVRLRSEWHLEVPRGGGDTKNSVLRGSRAELRVEQGPQTGYASHVSVRPAPGERGVAEALRAAVARWQPELPGLAVVAEPDGALRLQAPPALHSTHEEHFARELDAFLRCLEAGRWPADVAPNLRCKYTLLARASGLAAAEAPRP